MLKVSIIIPAYNRANFIGEAIESVLDQTFQDFEIVVVDDGSTDNTREIVQKYINSRTCKFGNSKTNLIYIYQDNKGVAGARNTGIKAAKGDYIAFIDSDDIWRPDKLELQVRILDLNPEIGLVYTDAALFGDKNSYSIDRYKSVNEKKLSGNIFKSLLLEEFYLPCSTVIFRKVYIEKVGYFDESLPTCEDLDMWLRITKEYDAKFINKVLVKHRIHNNNITKNIEQMEADQYRVLKKIFSNSSLSQDVRSLESRIWSNFYLAFGASYYISGNLGKARTELIDSIKQFPYRLDAYLCLIKCMLGIKTMTKLRLLKERCLRIICTNQPFRNSENFSRERFQ